MDTSDVLNIECDNVAQVVEKVFSDPPPPPHSYQLSLDGAQTQHDIFRALGQLLTHGVAYLYGNDVDVRSLNNNQLQNIQEYMHAFGWKVILNPDSPENYPKALPWLLRLPTPQGQTTNYVNVIFESLL